MITVQPSLSPCHSVPQLAQLPEINMLKSQHKGIRFSNVLYDPRIIWEQSISALCGLMRTTSSLQWKDHTAKVYTRGLFIRVQKEIVAGSWLCSIKGMSSDEGCIVEGDINLHQKVTRHYKKFKVSLRNKKNRYGEKNEAIEKLAMEVSIILDSCVHMLSNNEPKLSVFVNKMKAIKSELEAELPIVPTRTVSDFVQEFMGVKKPHKVKLKNPTCVRPKGREKSTHHNRRTCPGKNNVDVLYHAVVVPSGSDHVDGGL
ncbi:hypothetical protein Tco_0013991 [Tanacetum coccineum]